MCSGRVDPVFILKALESGADGVLVLGCHPGDCHYAAGNYKTMRRMEMLKKLTDQMGIESDRIRLDWVAASEGDRFAEIIKDMTEKIKKLGPFPRNGGDNG
jgi:F420-non-reducing hydrogenase iron-sulfur subunit